VTRRRPLLAALVVAPALAAGAWWWGGSEEAKAYDTAPVERGDLVTKVTATGTLSALVTVEVGSQVSGRIAELNADFNAQVHQGDVLARLDPLLFDAAVEQARANHAAAKANAARAEVEAQNAHRLYERSKALAERQLVAVQDRDTALTTAQAADAALLAAKADVARTAAALHQAETNRAYSVIRSPIDGIVISRDIDVGQTVAASFQAPKLFEIAEDLTRMQVDTSVAEADVGRLRDGMAATFTVDAWPGRTFEGTVRQIRNAPVTVQNVVMYVAVIDVENPDLALKPGMTANVTFVVDERKGALKVPNTALRWHPEDAPVVRGAARDERTVYVLKGGEPAPVPIKTGLTDGVATEVVSGALAEGDAVVTDAGGGEGGGPTASPFGGRVPRKGR
jgi:HlyD family secretion protein